MLPSVSISTVSIALDKALCVWQPGRSDGLCSFLPWSHTLYLNGALFVLNLFQVVFEQIVNLLKMFN